MTGFEGFVTREEASDLLRCSTKTLKRIEARKELQPVFLTERIVGYRESDLRRYLHERTKA